MNDKISFSERMKNYENVSKNHLIRRIPVIIRIDGKNFSNYTKNFSLFDDNIDAALMAASTYLMSEIQNAVFLYQQSDEISILMVDYQNINSEPYFDNNVAKLCSVSASIATMMFNKHIDHMYNYAVFDSRVFSLPKEEVSNYFIWRQKDCYTNFINKLARSLYSQKELDRKTLKEREELINEKNPNILSEINDKFKLGKILFKKDGEVLMYDPSLLIKEHRNVVEDLVYIKKED